MKKVWILIITLVITIGAGIWEVSYLRESSRCFLSDINSVYQIAERKDYDLAKIEASNLKETWKDIRKTWALFIDDNQMDEIGEMLISFVSYIDSKNDEKIKHSYNCLTNSVNDVVEFECLKPENVF